MGIAARRQNINAHKSGVLRVHCVGDSIIYSTGVPLEESVPYQLENALHQHFPNELFTCLNLGSEGWNLWNSLFHHQTLFPKGGADLIVLTICNNDAEYLGCLGLDYPGDKNLYWTDPLLSALVDQGLAAFKNYIELHKIPALIVFYQYWTDHETSSIIKTLCDKHGLSFLDIEKSVRENYPLSPENATVSPVDGHPNGLFHKHATHIIAQEIKRLKLISLTENPTSDVIDKLKKATQEMLNASFDPQVVFAWASRAGQTKQLVLPRIATDKIERQKIRDDLTKINRLIERSWLGWQQALWQEASISALHHQSFTPQGGWSYLAVHNHILRLVESTHIAVWCQRNNDLAALEQRMAPILPKIQSPNPESLILKLQSMYDRFSSLSKVFQKSDCSGQLSWPKPDGLSHGSQQFMNDWSTTVLSSIVSIRNALSTLMQESTRRPSEGFFSYISQEINDMAYRLGAIEKKISEETHSLNSPYPILAIDVEIKVHVKQPSLDRSITGSASIHTESIVPANIYLRRSEQLMNFSHSEYTYKVRLRFLTRANLYVMIRPLTEPESFEKIGASIKQITFRPVLGGGKQPETCTEKKLIIETPDLQYIALNDFWLTV
jgi:hypothetical protein